MTDTVRLSSRASGLAAQPISGVVAPPYSIVVELPNEALFMHARVGSAPSGCASRSFANSHFACGAATAALVVVRFA